MRRMCLPTAQVDQFEAFAVNVWLLRSRNVLA